MQSSSFIKGQLVCLFEYSLEIKTIVSLIYPVCEVIRYDEHQLHSFHYKNLVFTSINAQNHSNLRIIYEYFRLKIKKVVRILRLSKTWVFL